MFCDAKLSEIRGFFLKLIYSEKAAKFCKIFNLLLSYVVPVKSKVKISQNCKAFSEYMNFKVRDKNTAVCCIFGQRGAKSWRTGQNP